jgi:hypothetical protein
MQKIYYTVDATEDVWQTGKFPPRFKKIFISLEWQQAKVQVIDTIKVL